MSLSTSLSQNGATPGVIPIVKGNYKNFNQVTPPPVQAPSAPTSQAIKNHTVIHPDGTKVTQTYDTSAPTGENGMANKPNPQIGLLTSQLNNAQAKLKEAQGAGYGANDTIQKDATGNIISKNTPSGTYAGLIGQGASASLNAANAGAKNYAELTDEAKKAYTDAGNTNQVIGQAESAATHNPNFSLDTGIGRAGQIQQNYGLQGQNALTRASGLGSLASAGLTSQGQGISGLGSSAGLLAPQPYGLTTQPYNPATDTYGGGGTNGAIDRAAQAGKIGAVQGQSQDYQTGLAKLRAADNIQPSIVQTLASNPTLNQTPISAITNLSQWLAGQTSDPAQQQLASQVASYIQALGLSPDQAAQIAVQKGGTIGTLLDTLRQNVSAQNEGNNPANITGGGNSSGSITWDNI